jgi:spermidine/putrescine transport system permease protein
VLALVLLALYAPIAMAFIYSFNASPIGAVWTGFSVRWYGGLLSRRDLWLALRTSVLLGLVASTLSVVLGTLAALGLRRWRQTPRRLASGLLALPLVAPEIILGLSLALFFHALAVQRGLLTVALAHTAFGVAYAFVVMSAAVADLDDNLYAAALDCGATPWQAFWQVLVPVLLPSLAVAWLLVFALSFDDFLITFLTKGVGSDTLPVKIYSQMRFGVRPDTNALFVVLFLFTLALAAIGYRLTGRNPSPQPPPRSGEGEKEKALLPPLPIDGGASGRGLGGGVLRRALIVAVPLCALVAALSFSSSGGRGRPFEGQWLNVFNWSDYIDPDVIKDFEEWSGASVQYDNYSSDEDLEARMVSGGGYDVIFPSDKSLAALMKLGLLGELDRSKIPNWKNLDKRFLGVRHDPLNRYTAPYFWGTLAVGIRTDHVREPAKGFEVLFDERYKGRIVMMNDKEHVLAAALLYLGLPMNSTDDADLAKARDLLLRQRPWVQAYETDTIKEKLIKGEAWVALGWNGDILQARSEAPEVKCIVPESGTLMWVDSMAIPKDAPNPELAHAFINYLLRPDVAVRNARKVRYASPNKAARPLMDADLLHDPAVYPPAAVLDRCGWLEDRGQDIRKIERVWREVRR